MFFLLLKEERHDINKFFRFLDILLETLSIINAVPDDLLLENTLNPYNHIEKCHGCCWQQETKYIHQKLDFEQKKQCIV